VARISDLKKLRDAIAATKDLEANVGSFSFDANREPVIIEMPDVITRRRLSLQAAGVVGAEFQSPPPDGLVRNQDTALKQHFLDEAQA
jgi:hypothetical protein